MRWPRHEKQDDWSIATMRGRSPIDLSSLPPKPSLSRWQVSDVSAGFIADPFLCLRGGTFHLFFEVLNRRRRRGEIGLAVSKDGVSWEYSQIVLREDFHLSYPFVFEFDGNVYLLPECSESGCQHLYVAEDFPFRWRRASVLVESPLLDASLWQTAGLWWMFAGIGSASDATLNLFAAPVPTGPWMPHPLNPVRTAPLRMCRPGGRPTVRDDSLLLFTQDCSRRYGFGLRAYEVLKLNRDEYLEREVCSEPLLAATGNGWNSHGMHHLESLRLSESEWLIATDGNHRSLLY
jgi:hypothetical protein